jgi:hypothetical protein
MTAEELVAFCRSAAVAAKLTDSSIREPRNIHTARDRKSTTANSSKVFSESEHAQAYPDSNFANEVSDKCQHGCDSDPIGEFHRQ